MENTKFAAFVECVERGSLTGAANSLGYTPSAVSQLITTLEKDLGLTLLVRSKRGGKTDQRGGDTSAGDKDQPGPRRGRLPPGG